MVATGSVYEPRLGFKFYPVKYPKATGYPRLDIYIHAKPTKDHFDPEKITAPYMLSNGTLDTLVVRHPHLMMTDECVYRVCPGKVCIQDQKGKKIEVFSFGGKLRIESSDDYTVCSLESSAPIFNMSAMNPAQRRLADEILGILAERRAARLQSPGVFERNLCKINPKTLYCSFLLELKAHLKRMPVVGCQMVNDMRSLVRQEIQSLKKHGLWEEGHIPTIKDIL